MIGRMIGTCQIESRIGEGGMGEVYRATDTRLKRQVAIKVLPASVASDGDRLARFQREAEVLAALNHPGIAAIYGIEDVGETKALVMELVEGATLADRLSQSQGSAPRGLPLDEVLSIARQLANALEAAHEQGIIHRDLKPANIKVRDDGIVKVLDFGLAKALGGEVSAAGAGGASISPTITSPAMTQLGVILGTAAYMAPEQARGKRVDKRADIWAFGVVVYEMITGRRLFGGDDLTETLAQVLMKEPDLDDIPQQLRPLLDHCLRKDPARRLRDFSSVELLLETTSAPISRTRRGFASRWLWPIAAVALSGIAAAGWLRTRSPRPAPVALSMLPPAGVRLKEVGSLGGAPLISPDGSVVLFQAGGAAYVRRLDTLQPTPVPGSQQFTNEPFWGTDSRTIYYPAMTLGGWFRVRLPDGVPEMVVRLQSWSRGGGASASGKILLSDAGEVQLLDSAGAAPAKLDFSAIGRVIVQYPEFLPDGDDFIFFATPRDGGVSAIYLASLRGHTLIDPRQLLVNDSAGRYTPAGGGRLLFVRNDTLYAQRLDVARRQLVGDVQTLQTGVGSGRGGGIGEADFSVSRTGTIVWRPGITALSQVTAFDRHGAVLGTSGPTFSGSTISLAPDERRLLASDDVRMWVMEAGQPGILQAGTWESMWSPDGSGFLGEKDGGLWQRPVAGGEAVRIADLPGRLAAISADGSEVAYLRANLDTMIQKIRGTPADRTPRLLVATNSDGYARGLQFSPDGRWVVYWQGGLFVQSTSGPGLRHQIAADGRAPQWRGDGKEILAELNGAIISVPVDRSGPEPRFGQPQTLFRDTLRMPANANASSMPFAVTRDGSTIYWLQAVAQPGPDVIHVRTDAVSF